MIKNLDLITNECHDISSVYQSLNIHGICVLKSYISQSDIAALVVEHKNSFKNAKNDGIYSSENHPINEGGFVARGKTKHLSEKFKLTKSIFSSDFIKSLTIKCFGEKSLVCDEVFFTYERESKFSILPWHFDRQQSLKFYINLIDVDESNGAFEYDIGSHREGHFRANYYILSGVKVGKIPNDIPNSELHNPTIIRASAGDLIIFDPGGFHKAGTINEGLERKVIRGHSHPILSRGPKARWLDAHWWLQSPLNLGKILKNKTMRSPASGNLTEAATRK